MTPTQAEQKARALHSKLLSPYKDLAAINSAVETLTHLIQKSERCAELEQECKAWEQTTRADHLALAKADALDWLGEIITDGSGNNPTRIMRNYHKISSVNPCGETLLSAINQARKEQL